MQKFNEYTKECILAAAYELLEERGQLWVNIENEEYYIPELIEELEHDTSDQD